jgi:hypothetical protein
VPPSIGRAWQRRRPGHKLAGKAALDQASAPFLTAFGLRSSPTTSQAVAADRGRRSWFHQRPVAKAAPAAKLGVSRRRAIAICRLQPSFWSVVQNALPRR